MKRVKGDGAAQLEWTPTVKVNVSPTLQLAQSIPLADEDCVARFLYAAKPVTWPGRGDLPQFLWRAGEFPRLLVLDLWSGIGGLCVALLALGVHFYAVAAEEMDECVKCVAECVPSVVHISKVENVTLSMLRSFFGPQAA